MIGNGYYNVIGYHLYTCNFEMYELKFMKCMLLPSNQKIILFSEQRERTEQTEDGGHVPEHKERKHPTEALL